MSGRPEPRPRDDADDSPVIEVTDEVLEMVERTAIIDGLSHAEVVDRALCLYVQASVLGWVGLTEEACDRATQGRPATEDLMRGLGEAYDISARRASPDERR